MHKFRLAAAALLLSTGLGVPGALAACDDSANQAELNDCAAQDYARSDTRLNGLYGEIMQRLGRGTPEADQLVAAQKAWIAYRDAECAFVASGVAGGSIEPMVVSTCLADLTERRVEDFKGFLACEEGDVSCPVPAE